MEGERRYYTDRAAAAVSLSLYMPKHAGLI